MVSIQSIRFSWSECESSSDHFGEGGRLPGMLHSGTLVFALGGCLCVFCFVFTLWVVLHYGFSGPSSEVDGTFSLWVGSATCVSGQSIHQSGRFCGPFIPFVVFKDIYASPSCVPLQWGSRVVIPWAIEGIFKITSAVHSLLNFSESFSFTVDPRLLASNGYLAVKDVFGGSRVVIPWAFFTESGVNFVGHGIDSTFEPSSSGR